MDRRTLLFATSAGALASTLGITKAATPALPKTAEGMKLFDRPDVRAGDRPIGASFASRSAVYGASGAAGTAHPLATLVGIEILKKGGSAADAAIAINACLGLIEPTSCGVGGDVYALLWDPRTKSVEALASSGRSPQNLTFDIAKSRTHNGTLPIFGAVTVSVPGAVAGWWALHQRYGKLEWSELFQPAIDMAEDGTPIAPIVAYYLQIGLTMLDQFGGAEELVNARNLWTRAGSFYAPGDMFRNPDLAKTYRAIAAGGQAAFYDGPIADAMERYFRRIGGWLTRADLAAHRAKWTKPISTHYRGVDVHAVGENTQGLATLQMLNIMERFDMAEAGFQSARSIHLQVEAKRLAFEDRARYYGDPDFHRIPVDELLSKDYAAKRAALIRSDRPMDQIQPGKVPSHGDTTYFTVSDSDGLMISMIQSNYFLLGSGLVPDGLGFMLQNRGQLFSFQPGHPNIYQPGKRPFQTIIPGFATRDGKPWLSFSVMGGDMQPQGQVQVIANRVDYALDVQAAGDAPRWHHGGSSETMGEDLMPDGPTGQLHLENGVPAATRQALIDMGWKLGPGASYGRYHAIERVESHGGPVYAAGSEMRADGLALAY